MSHHHQKPRNTAKTANTANTTGENTEKAAELSKKFTDNLTLFLCTFRLNDKALFRRQCCNYAKPAYLCRFYLFWFNYSAYLPTNPLAYN